MELGECGVELNTMTIIIKGPANSMAAHNNSAITIALAFLVGSMVMLCL